VTPGELVFDLGAGLGALTGPLAASGAHVVAVERDPSYVRVLRRRCAGVSIVHADLRSVPLPRRDFRIVANIPFATTTALLRRLADWRWLVRADLVVEYGAARRFVGVPRDAWGRRLAARYDIRIGRRLAPECFTPTPSVDAVVLVMRRSGP
jgi:23S rRNA (adenine-N6)-dimethyltransferase